MIYPKEYLDNVKEIKLDFLKKNDIRGIILDVDNTLIDFDQNMLQGIEEWVYDLKKNEIKFCILSNSNKINKVKNIAEKLQVPFIYFAKKPFKTGFKKAKNVLDLEERNIAVVGDQILTDVIGANRCNMFSILVKPIKEKDYFVTRIKRPLEKIIINQYLSKKNKRKDC